MKRRNVLLSLKRGKRGASAILILRAFDLVLAAIIIAVLIMFLRNVWDSTFLEKTYIARDLAMLITTTYASPGELTYCYYEDSGFKFNYKIADSKIVVYDSKDKVEYIYLDDKTKPVPAVDAPYEQDKPVVVFELTKDSSGVKVVAKRKGEPSDTCKT